MKFSHCGLDTYLQLRSQILVHRYSTINPEHFLRNIVQPITKKSSSSGYGVAIATHWRHCHSMLFFIGKVFLNCSYGFLSGARKKLCQNGIKTIGTRSWYQQRSGPLQEIEVAVAATADTTIPLTLRHARAKKLE